MYTSAVSSPCPRCWLSPFTHPARQLRCPQNALGLGFTRGAGFPSTPIQSRLVSLSPSCQLLHISGELASAPPCPAPLPALCQPALGKQAMAAPASVSCGNGDQPRSSLLRQVGHTVQPATLSPTCLTHPHVFTAHLLCAGHGSRQTLPAFTELQITQKSLLRTLPPQQQQQLTVMGDMIGFARPRCTKHLAPSPVTLA